MEYWSSTIRIMEELRPIGGHTILKSVQETVLVTDRLHERGR